MIFISSVGLNASEMDFDMSTCYAQLIHNQALGFGCAQSNAKSMFTWTDAAAR